MNMVYVISLKMSTLNRISIFYGFNLLTWLPVVLLGFNIDTTNINVIEGPKGTMFGYTASFLPVDGRSDTLGMLVGAPNSNTTTGGLNSGALHLCENVLEKTEHCLEQRFYNYNESKLTGTIGEKFGSTLVMTNSGKFLVCSPNFKDTEEQARTLFTFLPGRCVLTDLDESTKTNIVAFRDKRRYMKQIGNPRQQIYWEGLANFGLSADSDKDSIFLFGAPGVHASEGIIRIQDVLTDTISRTYPSINSVMDGAAYGYLGYSVKIGRFCDGSDICFAASAPNWNRVGMVMLYSWKRGLESPEQMYSLYEEQAWAFYGYTLCAVDANNDGYDELLVGSPYYTDLTDTVKGYDQGRVYIYSRSTEEKKLVRIGILDGSRQRFARFGTAIQNIGDINLDTFNDVVVGAPDEEDGASDKKDGNGAIYIYLGGGPNGFANSPSQRIPAKQISNGLATPVQGFGFAFSDHAILADQKYPRFVATSVASDTIVVFKCRPIVDVVATLTANPNPTDMEKPCPEARVSGACFKINMCIRYSLRGGGNTHLTFKLWLEMDVQLRSNLKRALISLSNNSLVETTPENNKILPVSNTDDCTPFWAVLRENQVNQERFKPIEIIAHYALIDDPSLNTNPVLDALKPNNVSLKVTFVNKCGDDEICDVDLSVKGKLSFYPVGNWHSIVVNNTEKLELNIAVTNSNETSYWTVVKLQIDSPLFYNYDKSNLSQGNCKPEQQFSDPDNTVSNAVLTGHEKSTVVCNLYKPLGENESISFIVSFDTKQMELTKKTLIITAEALQGTSSNIQAPKKDRIVTMTTDVEIIADLSIEGTSTPIEDAMPEIKRISMKVNPEDLNNFRSTGNEIEPFNVTHIILIKNNGPSFLPTTKVNISVPMYLLDRTQLVEEAVVKIKVAEKITRCYETRRFESLQKASTPTTQSYTIASGIASSWVSTGTARFTTEVSTEDTFTFIAPLNRRKKRASDDKVDQGTVYTLDCVTDEAICQVFVCEIETTIAPGGYFRINVSLVIDKANIAMPENYTAFYYTVQTSVIDPTHRLFKKWDQQPTIKTVTKFYTVQPAAKINIWIIIGSVIAGLVLITIIVLVLWKLGFFKRDKHKQVEKWKRESQRRSRKGYSKAPSDEIDEGGSFPTNAESKTDAS